MTVTELMKNACDAVGTDERLKAVQDQYFAAASKGLAEALADFGIGEVSHGADGHNS